MTTFCYCSSGQYFESCCGPLLQGKMTAGTPEALMRSRYSAFCSGNVDYLVQTQLNSSAEDAAQIERTIAATKWLKLDVLKTEINETAGVVEFVAYYCDQRGQGQLHERSDFLKRDSRWFYTGGKFLPPIKPQRNDPCWCGSGKKFKKCCGT